MSSLSVLLLLGTLSTQTALAQINSVFSTYDNPTLGIRIDYPSDWKWRQDYGEVSFTLDQDNPGFALFVYVSPTGNKSLDENIMNMRTDFLQNPNLEFIEQPKITTLANYPARTILYSVTEDVNNNLFFKDGKYERKAMQVIMQANDKAYDIAYYAESAKYDYYLPTIQKMIRSFEITSQYDPTKPDFLTFKNSTYGMTMQYPSTWTKVIERSDGSDDCLNRVVTFANPSWDAQVNVYVHYQEDAGYSHSENLENHLSWYRDYHYPELYNDFNVTESDVNSTLSGYSAYKLEYAQKAESGREIKSLQIGTEIDSDAYYITSDVEAKNYSAYFPTIQQMINSFKIEHPKDFVCLVRGTPAVPVEKVNATSNEFEIGAEDTNRTSNEIDPGRM